MTRMLAWAGLLALTAVSAASAKETRCGWVQNPTPGNYWLDDRDASWTIVTQGTDPQPKGADLLPDFTAGEFVQTNGYYGYACACMSVDVDRKQERITQIFSVKQLPLSKCRNDPKIPKE